MGSWGKRLYNSDTACDVKERFLELMQKNLTPIEIEETIIREFGDYLSDEDDAPIVWVALADLQWHYGILSPKVKNLAAEVLETIMQNLQTGERSAEENNPINLVEARRVYQMILSQMGPAKRVHMRRTYQCQWRIGDMYAYKLRSAEAKAAGIINEYYIYHMVDYLEWSGDVYPVAYIHLTSGGVLPSDVRDVPKLLLVPSMIPPRPDLPISMSERTKSGDYIYRVALAIRSKAEEKRTFIYLGNSKEFPNQEGEYIFGDCRNTIQQLVARLEVPLGYNWMIAYLQKYNK